MTFERTQDSELIRRILTEPRCWRRMVNDNAPIPQDFAVEMVPGVQFIAALDRGRPLAVFLLCDSSLGPDVAEVHFSALPETWGAEAIQIVSAFIAWTWENSSLQSIVGFVPSYNLLCLRLALRVGFERYFTSRSVGTRRGKCFDLIHTMISRP